MGEVKPRRRLAGPATHAFRVSGGKARRFAARILSAMHVPADEARLVARVLVHSDLRGVHTHGLKFLPVYAKRILGGGCNPRPKIRVVSRGAWGVVLDGDAGLGQLGAMAAARAACGIAARRGIGFCACRNTSHVGAVAPYLLAAHRGRVVLGFTNTASSMAPPGGNFRAVGNNCMGFATPIAAAPPLCLDMTTSTESWGKVRARIEAAESLPEGVALLPDGSWAMDPGEALRHAVAAPLGGGKGLGLALLVDVLTAGLSGGTFSPDVKLIHNELSEPEGTCAAFLVFDLRKLPGGASLPWRLAEWRRRIKRGKRRPGVREVFVPGERSAAKEVENRRCGFPMTATLRAELNELAARTGIRERL